MQLARWIFLFLFFPIGAFAQTTYSCPANQYVATQLVNTGQGCSALPASVTNVSGATSGGFVVSTTNPTSTPVVSVVPDGTHYLPTATDQASWNGKQAAGNYITGLTGDVTAAGAGSAAATLATVNANVGSFGSATTVPVITFDAKGRATSVSTATITGGGGGTTFQSNGTALTSSSPVNYRSGSGNGGVIVSNPSTGNVDFNLSLPLAGTGVAIPTGPASSVSGNLAGFIGTAGQLRDTGMVALSVVTTSSSFGGVLRASYVFDRAIDHTVQTVASAGTIAPSAGIVHLTGTTTVNTITPMANMSSTVGGCFAMITDSAVSFGASGNIFAAFTSTAGTMYQSCYDGATWYIR